MILIEIEIDKNTKEQWRFNIMDLNVVFVGWIQLTRPQGKRKWIADKWWDKYGRSRDFSHEEPELPKHIKQMALERVQSMVTVKTWNEWKKD
jgi:hypothetical protein